MAAKAPEGTAEGRPMTSGPLDLLLLTLAGLRFGVAGLDAPM
jgi:hypothetical protein